MNSNNALYFAGGLVIGGVTGYLVTDLLIYKFLEEEQEKNEWEPEFEEESDIREGSPLESIGLVTPKKDYSSVDIPEKEELEELASKYSDITAPHIISLDEWMINPLARNKMIAMYYVEDTTFAWQDEDTIDAPQNIFGPNIHLHFGESEGEDDPDVVYVADPANETLYTVIQIHDAYEVQVLGKTPTSKKGGAKRGKDGKFIKAGDDEK